MGRRGPKRENASLSSRNQMKSRASIRSLLILATFTVAGISPIELVLAHSNLVASSIKEDTTVRVMPKTITLEFSEAVETGFSRFKLIALEPKIINLKSANATADAMLEPTLEKRNDEAARADDGLLNASAVAAKLEVKLKTKLPAGWYVMMWKVLSVDTHNSSDFFVFQYKP
jgi:copper resistance protein C